MRTIVAISALVLVSGCAWNDQASLYYDDLLAHDGQTSSITYDEREIFGPAQDTHAENTAEGIEITPQP